MLLEAAALAAKSDDDGKAGAADCSGPSAALTLRPGASGRVAATLLLAIAAPLAGATLLLLLLLLGMAEYMKPGGGARRCGGKGPAAPSNTGGVGPWWCWDMVLGSCIKPGAPVRKEIGLKVGREA